MSIVRPRACYLALLLAAGCRESGQQARAPGPSAAPQGAVTEAAPPSRPDPSRATQCIPLAWTCGTLPDAYDRKKLSGTVAVIAIEGNPWTGRRAATLELDQPICDPRGASVWSVQIDDAYISFAGKRVEVELKQFITARADNVHARPVIGSVEEPSDEATKGARDGAAAGRDFLGMNAGEVDAFAGTPAVDLGGSEGEACVVFTCAPRAKVCFAPGTEQAAWQEVLGRKAPVRYFEAVTEEDKTFARKLRPQPSPRAPSGAGRH